LFDSFTEIWLLPLAFVGLGSVFAVIGIIMLCRRAKVVPAVNA